MWNVSNKQMPWIICFACFAESFNSSIYIIIISDSLYMALSGDSLDALVRPSMRQEWEDVKKNWFPRTDTPENEAYDKRTPGK